MRRRKEEEEEEEEERGGRFESALQPPDINVAPRRRPMKRIEITIPANQLRTFPSSVSQKENGRMLRGGGRKGEGGRKGGERGRGVGGKAFAEERRKGEKKGE